VRELEYDERGNVTSVSDALGNTWTWAYDESNFVVSKTDPLGRVTNMVRDGDGRLTELSDDAGGHVEVSYTANRVYDVADGLGRWSRYDYDHNEQVTEIDRNGAIVAFTYDTLGALTSVTDPNGQVWAAVNDTLGRRTSDTDPVGNQTTYSWDARHRVATVTYADGAVLTHAYDASGNRTQASYSDGLTLDYAYDAHNRRVSGTGLTLGYDASGRMTESNDVDLAYDLKGRLVRVSYGEGMDVYYAYDARDVLLGLVDWRNGWMAFEHDAAGQLTAVERSTGVRTEYTYDASGQVLSVDETLDGGSLSSITLERDAAGQVTSATRAVPLPPAIAALSITRTYDAAAQIEGHTYDPRGRMTTDGARTFTYDAASRLIQLDAGGETATFSYDAMGSLTSRTSGGTTREFVWNYALDLPSPAIAREGATDLTYYVHTPDGELLYALYPSGARSWFHYDEMGNTIFLTNDAGEITDCYAYTPFGVPAGAEGSSDNPFTYAGQLGVMADAGGVFHMRTRAYDSDTRRFLQREPVGMQLDPQTINPYQYALLNPMMFADPTGESPADAAKLVVQDTGTGTTWSSFGNDFGTRLGAQVIGKSTDAGVEKITGRLKGQAKRLEEIGKTTVFSTKVSVGEKLALAADIEGAVEVGKETWGMTGLAYNAAATANGPGSQAEKALREGLQGHAVDQLENLGKAAFGEKVGRIKKGAGAVTAVIDTHKKYRHHTDVHNAQNSLTAGPNGYQLKLARFLWKRGRLSDDEYERMIRAISGNLDFNLAANEQRYHSQMADAFFTGSLNASLSVLGL
jgi:RHS repeat-associated protein